MGLNMKYSVQIKIFRGEKNELIQNYGTSIDINEDILVSELKENLKKNMNLLGRFEIIKESISLGNNEYLDNQISQKVLVLNIFCL